MFVQLRFVINNTRCDEMLIKVYSSRQSYMENFKNSRRKRNYSSRKEREAGDRSGKINFFKYRNIKQKSQGSRS